MGPPILHSQRQLGIEVLKSSNLKRVSAFKPKRGNTFFHHFGILGAKKIKLSYRRCSKNQNLHSRLRRRCEKKLCFLPVAGMRIPTFSTPPLRERSFSRNSSQCNVGIARFRKSAKLTLP